MSNYTNNLFDPETKNNPWVHLFEFVPERSRVLDIGCSSGNFGHVLINEKNCEVVGLDIDAPDITLAKKKLNAAYVRNIEREEIIDLGTFDVIVFADVLEHLLDPIAALEKAKKQLKKGGRIVFSIPNMAHISIRIQLMKGFFEYMPIGVLDRTHLHYYDEIEVRHIFGEAKMAIQEVNPATLSYPESKVSEELYRLGLGIVDQAKLNEILEDTKSNVWQFVGYALPASKKIPIDRKIKYRSPPEELQLTLEARDRELKLLGKRLQELETDNRHMSEFYRNPVKGGLKRAARRVRALQDKRAKPSN